jgi:hypothetical protein
MQSEKLKIQAIMGKKLSMKVNAENLGLAHLQC